MSSSPRQEAVAQSPSKSPLFTLGTLAIGHAPRQWERAATAPLKRAQRKGTKVWKRPAAQSQDALVSAQLLNDLAASAEAHAAKRQRTQHMPAVPAQMQTEAHYAPTLSDIATPGRRRKVASRRRSTRSPVKKTTDDSFLSPTKRVTRRRSSIKPSESSADRSVSLAEGHLDVTNVTDATQEPSFLEALDLGGSRMFEEASGEEESRMPSPDDQPGNVHVPSEGEEAGPDSADADGETSDCSEDFEDESTARLVDAGHTGVLQLEGGITELGSDIGEDSDDAASEEDEATAQLDLTDESVRASSSVPDEDNTEAFAEDDTLRLIDAGHTGVMTLGELEPTAEDEDDLTGTQTLTQDFDAVVQESVLASPESPFKAVGSLTASDAGDVSPAAGGISSTPMWVDQLIDTSIGAPSLHHTDSISTVAFDDMDVTGLTFGTAPPEHLSKLTSPPQNSDKKQEQDFSPLQKQSQHADHRVGGRIPSSDGEESADELFGGSPTLHKIVFSPAKDAPSPAPAVEVTPKKTRSGPRLSDDTTYLNDFLSRVRSQAAARSSEIHRSPVKISTPQKSPRKPLGELTPNSPSPSPAVARAKSPSKEKIKSKTSNASATGSPVKLPKTPIARVLLSSNMESPDTPDELVGAPALPPTTQRDDAASNRRSGRSKLTAPSRLPLNAPSNIPLRRADGDPPVLQRSDAQKLARTTAANTRRNKGGARFPKQVIESLDGRLLSPVKNKGIVRNRKGQNVDWDHRLVYYLEDTGKEVEIDENGRVIEKENGREVRRKVRIVKGERVDSEATPPEEVPQPASPTEPKASKSEDKPSKIVKAPRRVKVATPAQPPKAEEPAPRRAVPLPKTPTTKGRRVLKPMTSLSVKGTPAAKRMLSVEATGPPAKRRTAKKV